MIRHELILLILFLVLPGIVESTTFTVNQNDSIQAAIDEASPGDTILVLGGVHQESLIINKTLQLLGIGMPEIDSGDDEVAVNLSAGGSVLDGFLINCSNRTSVEGIGVKAISNNNLIINNAIKNYHHGIALLNSSHNIVEGNSVQDSDAGIYVSGGSLNKAIVVNASDNNYGIHLQNTTDNTIEGCIASHNSYGIFLDAARDCTVADNSVTNNSKYGIQLRRADDNSLIQNDVSHNRWEGIYLEDCSNNSIAGCNMSYNEEDGLSQKGGQGNAVIGSVFRNNKFNGISLDSSAGDLIIENNAVNNQRRGISIFRCTDCILLENYAGNNNLTGIEVNRGRANRIIGNNASSNLDGVSINNAEGYIASGNMAFYNENTGIKLIGLFNSTVINNTAGNNLIGVLLLESKENSLRENNISKNELIGLTVESSLNNTIASTNASDNLAGFIVLDSRDNSLEENKLYSRSLGIGLNNSSANRIFRNHASRNKIGIYLNRSNDSLIVENILDNNSVGLAINISYINLSNTNRIIDNENDILRNENESISDYQIWREKIGAEEMEEYLRSHKEIGVLRARAEATIFRPVSASITSARSTSRDTSPNLRVKIESEPSGAEIWIDGKPTRAVTPSERALDGKGDHVIELFLAGYEPLREKIYVTSSTAMRFQLEPEDLQKDEDNVENTSDLYVYLGSDPEGASIWLDGINTKKSTPDRIQLNRSGNHTFDLFLSGYEIYQGEINTTEPLSEPMIIDITLTPRKVPAGTQLPDGENESESLPGFLSWQYLVAISLIYYLTKGKLSA